MCDNTLFIFILMAENYIQKVAKRVVELGLMPGLDVLKLHPYRCTAVQMECKKSGMTSKFPFLFGTLNQLRNLARAMGYLVRWFISVFVPFFIQVVLTD